MLRIEIRYRTVIPGPITLRLTATPDNFFDPRFHQAFAVTLERTADVLHVPLPMPSAKLWWSMGISKPSPYRVCATLTDNRGMMDTAVTHTGLRKVGALADDQGWRINDRRSFIKGNNRIGSPWLSTVTRKEYRRDFRLVTAMNANATRVHDHVAGRTLYEVAGRMGLMVWRDAPLQWGYDDSAASAENAVRQTQTIMDQFGNSPVIIIRGSHNEPSWNSSQMEKRFPDWRKTLNQTLTRRVGDALAEDTFRIVYRFSTVEEYYWAGWYFGTLRDLPAPAKTGVITEFGAQALPRLSTLKAIIPAHLLQPKTAAADDPGWVRWGYHDFQPFQTFKSASILRGNNIQEMIENTQVYQARLVVLATESYRHQRCQPATTLFHFMFVETQPSINWGVADYPRQPKAGYYALQRAYQPILSSVKPVTVGWRQGDPVTTRLWAINSTWAACEDCCLTWQVR